MIEQILRSKAPIKFNDAAFAQWHGTTNILKDEPEAPLEGGVTVVSTDHDKNPQDAKDAVQKLTDELWHKPLWWILEIFPMPYTYQTPKGERTTWW